MLSREDAVSEDKDLTPESTVEKSNGLKPENSKPKSGADNIKGASVDPFDQMLRITEIYQKEASKHRMFLEGMYKTVSILGGFAVSIPTDQLSCLPCFFSSRRQLNQTRLFHRMTSKLLLIAWWFSWQMKTYH
jgi:hypothetical protein